MAGITKEIDAYVIKYRSSANGNTISMEAGKVVINGNVEILQ